MAKAKKPAPKSVAKKPVGDSTTLAAKVVLHASDETPDYYINYAEMASSANEFSLYGVRVPTKLSDLALSTIREAGTIDLEPSVQLTMPITLIDGLINALQTQKGLYEAQFGKITIKPTGGKGS